MGLRCAVHSAAAVGDAAFAGSLLTRIAGDERLRREWAMNILGVTGSRLLRSALYPGAVSPISRPSRRDAVPWTAPMPRCGSRLPRRLPT